ncbi:MAG: transcription termination/antitermination protein NusG [Hyphomicrobiaceae bacterium]
MINTQPHREQFAAENLRRQGFEAYCPQIGKRIRHARRIYDTRRPLFPSYVFVRADGAQMNWRVMLSTYGVRTVICMGDAPGTIDGAFIETLRSREVDGVVCSKPSDFDVGQTVKISAGPFEGLVGQIVELRDKDRVGILLDLLNNRIKAHLPASQLRLV